VGPDDPATLELDADADAFAWCAGRETSLRGVVDQTRELRERGLPVHWRVPLIPERVHRLEALFSLAREEGALPMLLPPAQELSADDRLFAWDFVRYRLLEAELAESGPDAIRRHLALERSLADPATRADLPAPVAPPSPAVAAWGQARDVAGVLADGLRALGAWGLAFGRRGRPPAGRVGSVVLIGAYGGDHIGDAAIVGGVLRRLNARHGTERAVLMSQRPTHTRHLVEMLDAPAEVRVDVYERDRIREALHHADAQVYAGGPHTVIPKQLVRHLHEE
jgi:hypothetical protein